MSTPNRAQIPISFQYTNAAGDLIPIPIATVVTINNRATGTPATVYTAETGLDTIGFIQTDEGGNIQGWLEQGSYVFSASANLDANPPYAGAQLAWEAVCGDRMKDAESNIAILQGNVTDIGTTTTAIENSMSPIGAVTMYLGTTDPADGCWKLLQGGTVVRASFPGFSTWAMANGFPYTDTVITLPDMRQRFPVGVGGGYGLRGTGGEATHALTASEMPSHSHGGATGYESTTHYHYAAGRTGTETAYHQHNWMWADALTIHVGSGGTVGVAGAQHVEPGDTEHALHAHDFAINTGTQSGGHYHSVGPEGGSAVHNNIPPYIGVNYIIRVK